MDAALISDEDQKQIVLGSSSPKPWYFFNNSDLEFGFLVQPQLQDGHVFLQSVLYGLRCLTLVCFKFVETRSSKRYSYHFHESYCSGHASLCIL